MDSRGSTSYSVQVDLPADAFTHHPWAPAEIARKAADLAGIPKAQFVLLMGKHQISPFDYDPGELEAELHAATRVAGT